MTTITDNQEGVTLVNVFTVDPDDQQALVDLLIEATEGIMQEISGFISANIHASLDGERVVNYALWESREAFEAMFEYSAEVRQVDFTCTTDKETNFSDLNFDVTYA